MFYAQSMSMIISGWQLQRNQKKVAWHGTPPPDGMQADSSAALARHPRHAENSMSVTGGQLAIHCNWKLRSDNPVPKHAGTCTDMLAYRPTSFLSVAWRAWCIFRPCSQSPPLWWTDQCQTWWHKNKSVRCKFHGKRQFLLIFNWAGGLVIRR